MSIRPPPCGVGLESVVPVQSEVTTAHNRQTKTQVPHDQGDGSQSTESSWYTVDGMSREQWWWRRRMSVITTLTGHVMKVRWNSVTTMRRDAISIISCALTLSRNCIWRIVTQRNATHEKRTRGGGLMRIPSNALFGILMVISAYPEVRPAHTAVAGMFQSAYCRLCSKFRAYDVGHA